MATPFGQGSDEQQDKHETQQRLGPRLARHRAQQASLDVASNVAVFVLAGWMTVADGADVRDCGSGRGGRMVFVKEASVQKMQHRVERQEE